MVSTDADSVGVDAFRRVVPLLVGVAAAAAILSDPGSWIENLVAAAATVPFLIWARWPQRMPLLALVALVSAAELFAQRSGALEPLLFLLSIAAAVVGAGERSRVVVALAGLVAAATPFVVAKAYDDGILYGVWVMGIVLPLALGWGFRRQLELAAELSAARHELARQAAQDERRRIARDVHDLVGHGLAAVLLHVTGARHVLRRDVEAADEALAVAETVGRRSLQELRSTLTLLRTPDTPGEADAPPVPDAGDIADAVHAARVAGVDAEFRVQGDLGRVDPIVGLSLHRVAEEALDNARRYAPLAVTDVLLDVDDDVVLLTVESVGPLLTAPPHDADRPRYGLVGMRERMAAVGGELQAGPTPGGWVVRCRAPLAPAAATEADA